MRRATSLDRSPQYNAENPDQDNMAMDHSSGDARTGGKIHEESDDRCWIRCSIEIFVCMLFFSFHLVTKITSK